MTLVLLQLSLVTAVLVSCAEAQSYGELRFVRGEEESSSPASGLLEIFLEGEWGTICDTGFDIIDANVACRQMGYGAAVSFVTGFHSAFGIGENGSVWLSNVDCRDPEGLHLLSCAHGDVGVHGCDHYSDVAVVCNETSLSSVTQLQDGSIRLTGGLHKSQGIVEIACSGRWGMACGAPGTTFGQKEADAVCWQLGFTQASRFEVGVDIQASGLDNQVARQTWHNLPTCTEDHQSCTFTCRDTEVACSANLQNSNISYGISVECNHTITYGTLRLAGAESNRNAEIEGRLEIFSEGHWGTICAAKFDSVEADLACQQLGYFRALWYSRSEGSAYEEESTGPITLMGIECTAEDKEIAYCSRPVLPKETVCTHRDDVILACTNDLYPITTGAEVLINNSWPLPFSKRFLIEISAGAGLSLVLCCCCLTVWCTYCCCQRSSSHKHSRKMSRHKLLQDVDVELNITDNSLQKPPTASSDEDSETKQHDVIVLAAKVQEQLKPSPVPCTSPVVPQEMENSQCASLENAESATTNTGPQSASTSTHAQLQMMERGDSDMQTAESATNTREQVASVSAHVGLQMETEGAMQTAESATSTEAPLASMIAHAGLQTVEAEGTMQTGVEQEQEKGKLWGGIVMEPIPEEDGEGEAGGTGELTEEQPSAFVVDQSEQPGENREDELGMEWAVLLQNIDGFVEGGSQLEVATSF